MVEESNREDLLLRGLADLQNDFEKFRESTGERLGRLERSQRRHSDEDEFGLGSLKWFLIAALAASFLPMLIELFARMRKEKMNVPLPLP